MIDWVNFTPISLVGGILIGLASVLLWWFNGRIAGMSGIIANLLSVKTFNMKWQWAFIIGLVASPWIYQLFAELPPITVASSPWIYILGGLIVGFGTRLGSGCTSGHGICGLSRLSTRSFVAVGCFMACAFLTVLVTRYLLGG